MQERLGLRLIMRAVRRSFDRQVARDQQVQCSMQLSRWQPYGGVDHIEANVTLMWKGDPPDPKSVLLVDDSAMSAARFVVYPKGDGVDRHGMRLHSGSVAVPAPTERWIWWVSGAWTWGTTAFVTDYVLPLIVGISPLVFVGVTFVRSHFLGLSRALIP